MERKQDYFSWISFSLLSPRCPPCVCEPEDGNDGQVGRGPEGCAYAKDGGRLPHPRGAGRAAGLVETAPL